ncbi:MAG: fumarylacetoacetate hydrolase family protein [Deltaproteobacteria bacterium]|nr:fumarylacetoacetate hydrolase family protein [Deltaproteobacteria bacterium]
MMIDERKIEEIASQLLQAQNKVEAIPPLTESYPTISIEDAYRIQFCLLEKRLKRGEKLIGWKVGATSKAVMEQLSFYEPILGHLTDSSVYPAGTSIIPFESLIQPGIEPEVAFRLKTSLRGPGVSSPMVSEAVEWVYPAVEIIDCRIKDWKVKIQDIISDNSLHRGILLGLGERSFRGEDLADGKVTVEINGQSVAVGSGREVLGNPIHVVAWLANKLAGFKTSLNQGDIIMTGSMTRFILIGRGDAIKVSFNRLGLLEFSFK